MDTSSVFFSGNVNAPSMFNKKSISLVRNELLLNIYFKTLILIYKFRVEKRSLVCGIMITVRRCNCKNFFVHIKLNMISEGVNILFCNIFYSFSSI